ncbi:alkaline phosphatase family protein [Bacillus sp. AK128]
MRVNEEQYVVLISIDGMANYYLTDPNVKMPNLRQLISEGTSAKSMESVFPTATWAIHTSMITGKYPRHHGVLGNWVIDRKNKKVGEHFGDRTWDKDEIVLGDTLYDILHSKGKKTASICWPVTRGAQSIDYNIPEFYDQELFERYSTPSFWKELKEKGFPVDAYGEWSTDHARGQMQDYLTTEIANYLIENKRPDLLMLHFLLPDSYQHDYGTRSQEVYWSLEYIDEQIGKIITQLKSAGLYEDTTMFVVSDHGFIDTIRTLYPNRLFKQAGWFNDEKPQESKVMAVSNGGSGFVYVLEEDPIKKKQLYKEVLNLLKVTEGVGEIFEKDQFPSLGLPGVGEVEAHCPDLIFESEINCFVHFDHTGEQVIENRTKFRGMHGFLPTREELKAVFVASGKGIQKGKQIEEVKVVDVAPTIARIFEEELSDVDGKILNEIFIKQDTLSM